nr:unnamed protein product [Spirometra erinaceieuropaei]
MMIALLFVSCLLSVLTADGRVDPCKMPIIPGVCRARIPMYAYHYRLGVCEEFVYRGCGGNMNRFETLEDCERTCVRRRHRI